MTPYGFFKHETSYIPNLIQEDEHVQGVIYGRFEEKITSVVLIATDRRVIFVDKGPFRSNIADFAYENIKGVKMSISGPFAEVILQTRNRVYMLRLVNIRCAKIFAEKVELNVGKHIDKSVKNEVEPGNSSQNVELPIENQHSNDNNTMLDDTGTLSTVGSDGRPTGSVIHYITDKDDNFYFLTKADTKKSQNIEHNDRVALTIHPSGSLKALYVEGVAEPVTDPLTRQQIYEHIAQTRQYHEGIKLPPVVKIKAGAYIAYRIKPKRSELIDYSETSW